MSKGEQNMSDQRGVWKGPAISLAGISFLSISRTVWLLNIPLNRYLRSNLHPPPQKRPTWKVQHVPYGWRLVGSGSITLGPVKF